MAIGIQRAINQIVGGFTEATRSPGIKKAFQTKKESAPEPEKPKPDVGGDNLNTSRSKRPKASYKIPNISLKMAEKAIQSANNEIFAIYTQQYNFKNRMLNRQKVTEIVNKEGKK